jgi:hydrogenase maturation protein HypF
MLPYSPLHHLLLADAGTALVMTSGNVSDEPIAYRDDDALERLREIADLFLLHDRPIHMRTDDSVARTVVAGDRRRPLLMRRSRGYVPASLDLPVTARAHVLACGAELKSTFCVAKGGRAWVGHHIGDLRTWETLRSYAEGVEHFERLFAVEPVVVAHDLHPEYLSTKYATARDGVRLEGVQHHHAHLAACLAEHGEDGPAVGAIYDGTGYGTDGTVWGGELLAGGLAAFERVGHLLTVRMPGGDAAVREPWRMACAWLVAAGEEEPALPSALGGEVAPAHWRAIAELARTGLSAPETSSMGRLFDAVAALCGVRARVNYEGQAAVELEAVADRGSAEPYPMPVRPDGVLDARPTVRAVVDDVSRGTPVSMVAARFHAAVAEATAVACARATSEQGVATVVLSGGVFQNRLLLERTAALLGAAGLRVLVPEQLPPNDGGVAYGQAAVAAARGG